MTVLITGATGFIGSALIGALTRRGQSIRALTRRAPPEANSSMVDWRRIESLTSVDWPALLDGVTCVYHLAWSTVPSTSDLDPAADAHANVVATIRLLTALRRGPSPIRLVFSSSGGTVYGAAARVPSAEADPTLPMSTYGVAKLAVENYVSFFKRAGYVDGVSLRISNPFGPDQRPGANFGAVANFMEKAMTGEPIRLFGDGSLVRDFIYIDDLIEALVAAGARTGGPAIVNVGSGAGRSMTQVIAAIGTVVHARPTIEFHPSRPFDVPVSVLDISVAKTAFDWSPAVAFEEGLERTFRQISERVLS